MPDYVIGFIADKVALLTRILYPEKLPAVTFPHLVFRGNLKGPEGVKARSAPRFEADADLALAGVPYALQPQGCGKVLPSLKLAGASGVSAVAGHTAVPRTEGARAAAQAGHLPGGSRPNLEWVLPHTDADAVSEDDLLLLADAQTSGGLLVAGELPGAPVIGN
jgi:selenide,water dikinase